MSNEIREISQQHNQGLIWGISNICIHKIWLFLLIAITQTAPSKYSEAVTSLLTSLKFTAQRQSAKNWNRSIRDKNYLKKTLPARSSLATSTGNSYSKLKQEKFHKATSHFESISQVSVKLYISMNNFSESHHKSAFTIYLITDLPSVIFGNGNGTVIVLRRPTLVHIHTFSHTTPASISHNRSASNTKHTWRDSYVHVDLIILTSSQIIGARSMTKIEITKIKTKHIVLHVQHFYVVF